MDEELLDGGSVDQGDMADSYFDSYQEVDGEGNISQDDPTVPQQPQQPTQPQGDNNMGVATAVQPQAPQQPQSQGQGFQSRFFQTDDKGNQSFDAQSAHSFLTPGEGLQFKYTRQEPTAPLQPVAPVAPVPPQEEVPEWKKPFVAEQDYQTKQADMMLLAVKKAREALGDNPSQEELRFLNWQEQQVKEHISQELLPQWRYEQQEKQAREGSEARERTEHLASCSQKSDANCSSLSSKIGGDEVFNQFFFGSAGANGMFQPGPATEAMQYAFDITNPDKRGLAGQEYTSAMKEWWGEFTAEPQNLNYLYNAGLNHLRTQMWPQLVDKIGATKEQEMQGQRRSGGLKSNGDNSVRQTSNPNTTGHPDLDEFLGGPVSV